MEKLSRVAVVALIGMGALVAGCSTPPPPEPSSSENIPSAALLEECPELTRLITNLLGPDGQMVGQPWSFLTDKKAEFQELYEFLRGIRLKEGLNAVELDQLKTLTLGLYSLGMTLSGTPVTPEADDVGAFWIDEGVTSVRMWCP